MSLKQKTVLLVMLSLLSLAAVGALLLHQSRQLAEQQVALLEERLYAAHRAELKHYVELALAAIRPLYESGRDDAATREQAKALLAGLDYGDDGYFFAYDTGGNSLVHPRKPELVGHNLWALTDPHGRQVIQALLHTARRGDGFARYEWEKPSTGKLTGKLGYVVHLPRWDWMIGTGVYLDDVEREISASRAKTRARIDATLGGVAALGLCALLLVLASAVALNVAERRRTASRLGARARRLLDAQEAERSRIAAALRDGLGQRLEAARIALEHAAARDDGAALAASHSALLAALDDTLRLAQTLQPAALDAETLAEAIARAARDAETAHGVRVTVDNRLGRFAPQAPQALALSRLAGDALALVAVREGTRAASVELHEDGGTLCLTVRGHGGANRGGRSDEALLQALRDRAEPLGGRVASTASRDGAAIAIRLPATAPRTAAPEAR
ncbi:two-component system NarL family sensor kinase [Crenobacter luteus]|uniref:cache domain-containing protein n=1 Tax=Crenobacter luteus TaxID=1452487 RepID=UPI001054020F|nr:cache domain-containing protein [Crenobacter luteus]TCP12105.1 two-component system NarL family sensor kinase [Crenobacter luteus]